MTRSADSKRSIRTVQSTDPRHADFVESGFEILGESWGARFSLDGPADLDGVRSAVDRVLTAGLTCRECTLADVDEVVALDRATAGDYPVTPATLHEPVTREQLLLAMKAGSRFFGIWDGAALVAVTMSIVDPSDRAETEFTAVVASHRRRGLATGVKAVSILALAHSGVREFGTGGAAGNDGIIRANETLGYVLTERWTSFLVSPS